MDLLDIKWFPLLRNIYNSFVEEYRQTNRLLPRQNPERSKAHRLDCAYFDYIVDIIQNSGENIRIVLAVFLEGERVFPNSAIFDRAHIQIAVRDTSLIEESCLIEP